MRSVELKYGRGGSYPKLNAIRRGRFARINQTPEWDFDPVPIYGHLLYKALRNSMSHVKNREGTKGAQMGCGLGEIYLKKTTRFLYVLSS